MGDTSEISWTDSTFNPWIGCTKVSPECDGCYAERDFDHRLHVVKWGAGMPRQRTSAENWRKPLRWERDHEQFFAEHGRRQRVFCASLADVFDNEIDPQWRADLWDLIDATPHLDWLLLTKRIGNVNWMIPDRWSIELPPQIWMGATMGSQPVLDRDIEKLLRVKARIRFISVEPMLGSINFEGLFANPGDHRDGTNALEELDWVIVGGESGPNARPMNPDWARSLRDQCQAAGVAFHFKQWGEWLPLASADEASNYPDAPLTDDHRFVRVGKKAAGRLLDGRTWDEFPNQPIPKA